MRNPTLKGHNALIVVPWPTPAEATQALRDEFPDLKVTAVHQLNWKDPDPYAHVTREQWEEATIVMSATAWPAPEGAQNLVFAQLPSAGANHLADNPIFRDTDVQFCSSTGVHGPQIAEWVISTYLAFEHALPKYLEYQREKVWKPKAGNQDVEDAVGKRVGILGYGAIGRQVARISIALGMSVHAYTLHEKPTPSSRRDNSYTPPGTGDPEGLLPAKWFSGSSKEDLHRFLGSGLDLVVVALPLTDLTRGLIGKDDLEVLARGKGGSGKVFLTNIARGPIVVTDDLVEALNGGLLRGAALDVTDPEPLPEDHPLWTAKNVIITPHVSGNSSAYLERVLRIFTGNLRLLSEGKPLMNVINKKEGY